MSVLVVLGFQWGDEGKGKIIDWLSLQSDIVARFQGGNNAGHTVIVGDAKYILHLIPSGIIHEKPQCLIGNGVVIDAYELQQEIDSVEKIGIQVKGRLFVSSNAHCLMPYHVQIDKLQEQRRGKAKIGTTGRGIGACYGDKTTRHGVRVCDLMRPERWDFFISRILEYHNPYIHTLDPELTLTAEGLAKVFSDYREILEPLAIDGPSYLHEAITTGKRVMCEGAQGLMLDVDFGTYPFVTSSNPSPGGVCTGLGLPPMAINRILGVAKAYTTRVGAGPFPTEFEDDLGDRVRELGGEYGATTGRPRRCGWFDAALIRRSAQLSGATDVAITKLDVLDTLEELRICTGYKWNGKELDIFPFGLGHEDQLEPIYETLPGWQTPLSHMRHTSDLPERAINYVKRIEELCGIRVSAVSVGAERSQTILIKEISFFD